MHLYSIACVHGKGSVSSEHFAEEMLSYFPVLFRSGSCAEQCLAHVLVYSKRRLIAVQPPPPTCPVVAVTCVSAPRASVGMWVCDLISMTSRCINDELWTKP